MKALILAAGLGTRLHPYTQHTPKPLFPIGGKPLLDRLIEQLAHHGCTDVMLNTHHLGHKIAAHVHASHYRVPVQLRHEPEILGTAGAIRNLADFWDAEPFMVINGDILTDIDLGQVYTDHCRRNAALTMVLYDFPAINTVYVNADKYVCGFEGDPPEIQTTRPSDCTRWTFTGIQVVHPEVLADIAPEGPADSLTWYRRLLARAIPIRAHLAHQAGWCDLGTPEAYRQAARQALCTQAFQTLQASCTQAPGPSRKLAGDGSDRHWYRLHSGSDSLILGDHGIRLHLGVCEVDAFSAIGRHLERQGVPVPHIHAQENFAGLVIMQDLGDCHLQAWVKQAPSAEVVRACYGRVLEALLQLGIEGAKGFQRAWTYQSAEYDRELILEKECRYFMEAFVTGYMGYAADHAGLQVEFEHLADQILSHSQPGLIHRDCQSRNIMVHQNAFYFIDFQGARPGPLQYDLASLLLDPYVALPESLQAQLLEDYLNKLAKRQPVNRHNWQRGYEACCLSRLLQMLGAFSFLTTRKGKPQFADYIPIALATLQRHLSRAPQFPRLRGLVERLLQAFT